MALLWEGDGGGAQRCAGCRSCVPQQIAHPFPVTHSAPLPPRQDPTCPRTPRVSVRVPPPQAPGGPRSGQGLSSPQPHACCHLPLGGHHPQTWQGEGTGLGRGESLQRGILFRKRQMFPPPGLWVVLCPDILPPESPMVCSFFIFPVINHMLTQPISSS